MNEAKDQARVRDTKINVALYNAATDYAEYVMSDRSNYDEAMRLASALEAAAVAYAKIAGGEKPEANPIAEAQAGSFQRMVRRFDELVSALDGLLNTAAVISTPHTPECFVDLQVLKPKYDAAYKAIESAKCKSPR